ncbi:PTS mannitol transporter subunit IICB [Dolosigranulum pigrum]|uniref:PTS mannitol transporter subunit IICB n=1 Tax=Dolosigranulum pigrum TaxID=29394 RepID=UPI001AD89EF0|nr:PTS mannitol transporter subunit IICB [Dolosigranulum pigrum]QTJ56537.1 PTS mannitol transporter subunit IICB [Dolosigranulum pigrum]
MSNQKSVNSKSAIQRLGSNLSSMIMPNIGALIAWGLITMLFIPDGFLPNEELVGLVDPMIVYLIPILIAFSGGNLVYDHRGGVVGVIGTMGVILGADAPMLLGAMVLGPLGGWLIKKFDELVQDSIPTGFEMLVNNFSSGILGFLIAITAYYGIGPLFVGLNTFMANGTEWIIQKGLLPLANVFIEPAKVLFLNNAINHGIFTPLGAQQTAEAGKSIIYLLETNPGPGVGILLAYMVFGKGSAKSSAYGASIIHFFGGIHEIYFPYVMMKPLLFIAAIAGGVTGTFINVLFDSGLTSAASPGSIFAIMGLASSDSYFGVAMGVLSAAVVSFLIAAIILKFDNKEGDLQAAQVKTAEAKAVAKGTNSDISGDRADKEDVKVGVDELENEEILKIIFACDAGMGSSAMGASLLKKKAKEANITDIEITNSPVSKLKDEEGLLIITQEELTPRAKEHAPNAVHVSVDNFLGSPKYDEVIDRVKK